MDSHIWVVIMAGGAGSRFWPASTLANPKQFLPLHGDSALLTQTVDRLGALTEPSRILVVTGRHLEAQTQEACPTLPKENILLEPMGRNTAPCIAWATAVIAERDSDAKIVVLPADHAIRDTDAFCDALREAAATALDENAITTVAIQPTRPETGYGYLELESAGSPSRVMRFTEKPELAIARTFFESGRHYWNGGIFAFTAKTMMGEIERTLPAIAKGAAEIAKGGDIDAIYPTLDSISIDHGVMEKAESVFAVKGDFGWSDLGSWLSAWELGNKDEQQNVLPERGLALSAHRNHVHTVSGKNVVLVDVDDLVVVESENAILVMPRESSQRVKDAVQALKARGDEDLL